MPKAKSEKRQRPKSECLAQANRTARNKHRQLLKRLKKAKAAGRDREVQNLTETLQRRQTP